MGFCTSVGLFMLSNKEQPKFNVCYSWQQENLYIKFRARTIASNHVRILVPYYLFIDYVISGSYSLHSMLGLINEEMVFIYNEHQ